MSDLSIVENRQIFLRAGNERLNPSKPADALKIKDLLAPPNAVWSLVYNGEAAEVVALVKALPHDAQTAILTAPDVVRHLAHNGGQAAEVVALVKALPHDAQTAILAAPDTVRHLAYGHQAAEVVAVVKALPHDAQTAILAAPDAVRGLAYNGQAEELRNIRAGWEHTAAVRPLRVGISDAPKGQEP